MRARDAAGLAALLLLAGCVSAPRPAPAPPPAPVRQWPEAMRVQRLPSPAAARRPPARTAPKSRPAPRPRPATTAVPPPPAPAAWEATGVTTAAREVAASTYVVAVGDNLGRIGDRTGAGAEAIARANGIAPPYPVHVGQRLRIPAGRYHRVARGQSGIAIARAYGVEWSRVADLNQLAPPYILREGQRLLVPSVSEVAAMTMEQRAAAFRLDIDDLVTGGEPAVARDAPPAKPARTARAAPPPTVAVAEPSNFSGRFSWPLKGRILRPFGSFGDGARNNGVNIAADKGAPIAAAADGVVAYAGTTIQAYGGLILIRHGDGWITAYGNADSLLVTRGQAVKRGQVIARAGDTGYVTEPQLHFEVRQGRRPINPATMLPAE